MNHTRKYLIGAQVLRHANAQVQAQNILIEDGKIAALLPPNTRVEDAQQVDVSGMLIHPGLVNAHTHSHSGLSKGLADRWSLELLLAAGSDLYGSHRQHEKYVSTLVIAAELALKGCTAVYDMTLEIPAPSHEGTEAVARAYAEIGLRAVIAPMVSDIHFFQTVPGLMERLPEDIQNSFSTPAPASAAISNMQSILEEALRSWLKAYPTVKLALAPTIPLHCSDELWKGCLGLAQKYGLSMQSHLLESKVQALSGLAKYGKTITAHLEELGVLGPNFVASHGVWLDDDDMHLLSQAGASVSHNPSSNMLLGSGMPDIRRMMEHGINISLGTDGSNCSDSLNMYESMRTALRISHVLSPDVSLWLCARDVFKMATENGARALGIQGIGRIDEGYQADLVMLDLSHPNWLPMNDCVTQIAQGEDATAVHSTMVAGQWIVRDYKLVNQRFSRISELVQTTMAQLKARQQDDAGIYKRIAPVISCFCPALMKQPYIVERFACPIDGNSAHHGN